MVLGDHKLNVGQQHAMVANMNLGCNGRITVAMGEALSSGNFNYAVFWMSLAD